MAIDPNIPLSTFANAPSIGASFARAAQLKNLRLRQQMEQMQFDEAQKKLAEEDAYKAAAAGAVTPQQTQQVNIPGASMSTPSMAPQSGPIPLNQLTQAAPVQLPSRTDSLTSPASFDPNRMLSNLAANPKTASMVPQFQGQMAQTANNQADAKIKTQQMLANLQESMGKLDAQSRATFSDATQTVAQAAGAVLNSPPEARAQVYQQAMQSLAQNPNPMVQKMLQNAPAQYQPGMEPYLQEQLSHAMAIKDIADRVDQKPLKPTPGVEVPLSPSVEAQKIRIAQASKTVTAPLPGGGMTEDAKDMAAKLFLQTGQLPSLGMGKDAAGLRRDILNRAAELGKGQSVAGNKADYGANSSALKQVVGMKNAVEAYENTAGKNLDLFIEQAKNVPDTGIPILNAPARALAEKMGNDKVSAYNAARQVALTEIARVVSNPNLTGQLSDSARTEVSSFNPQSATLGQTLHIAQVLRADMKNRHDSLVEQEKVLKGVIGGGNNGALGASDHPFFNQLGGTVVK